MCTFSPENEQNALKLRAKYGTSLRVADAMLGQSKEIGRSSATAAYHSKETCAYQLRDIYASFAIIHILTNDAYMRHLGLMG